MERGNMDHSTTIFISIASYRDPELLPTLKDMMRHAAHPERLHIAICWQDDQVLSIFEQAGMEALDSRTLAGHEVFAFRYCGARIDIISVHYYTSQGACWARSLAESLYENEHYFLQIDSHCRFIPDWDDEMIAMLLQLKDKSGRPIISTYPPGYTPGEDEESSKKTHVSRLIFREFNPQGIPTLGSTPVDSTFPVRGNYLAGGFIFTSGCFVKTVPNDPHIFFVGEEIAMAVRAFTHGYDVYHPHKPLLWHYYQRKEHKKVWGDHTNQARDEGKIDKPWWERDNVSKTRVRTLLGLEGENAVNLAPYTPGTRRTLKQFEYQAGICLRNGTILPEVVGPDKVGFFDTSPADETEWLARHCAWHRKEIKLDESECNGWGESLDTLHLNVYDQQNVLLYKRTLDLKKIAALRAKSPGDGLNLTLEFKTTNPVRPTTVRVCPWSIDAGWGAVTEKTW